jgi:hypothetical protein
MLRFLKTFISTQQHYEWIHYSEFHTNRAVNVANIRDQSRKHC